MKTCFFMGHRDAPGSLFPWVERAIERHIVEYRVTSFVVGRYGNFDGLAAHALASAKQRHPEIRLTLLLAYYDPLKPVELPRGFDDSLYPEDLERVPRRAAIVRANRYMIRHSDYLIAYDTGKLGNTRALVEYARRGARSSIHIENLADSMRDLEN